MDMDAESLIGEVLAGRYRLERVLGSGGMGVVYEATQLSVGRRVAVKAMRPELAQREVIRQRFFREAKIAASFRHPNIVGLIDFDQDRERGIVFIAMEFVDGRSLADILVRGPLDWRIALRVAEEVATGLAEAHAHGIVHRDLKPENLIVATRSGEARVMIVDFGIALPQELSTRLTREGVICGTPLYMAPEQARAGEVDERADLYTLGCILFEMLTGAAPFQDLAGPMNLLVEKVKRPGPPVRRYLPAASSLPVAADALLADLLAVQPEDRVPNAREVLRRLRELLGDHPAKLPLGSDAADPYASWYASPERDFSVAMTGVITPEQSYSPPSAPVENTTAFEPPTVTRRASHAPARSTGSAKWITVLFAVVGVVMAVGLVVILWPGGAELDESRRAPPLESESTVVGVSTDAGHTSPDRASLAQRVDLGDARPVAVEGCEGLDRTSGYVPLNDAIVYRPIDYDIDHRHPVLLAFHETHSNPRAEIEARGYDEIADENRWVVIAPRSTDLLAWSGALQEENVLQLFDEAKEFNCLDDEQVLAVGMGAGGRMVERLSCRIRFTAAATVNWKNTTHGPRCDPEWAFPYMAILPDSPQMPEDFEPTCIGKSYLSRRDTQARWRRNNGCSQRPSPYEPGESINCIQWKCEAPYVYCAPIPRVRERALLGFVGGDVLFCDPLPLEPMYPDVISAFLVAMAERAARLAVEPK